MDQRTAVGAYSTMVHTVQQMVQSQYYFGLGVFLWERGTGSGALFWGTGERWWPVAELWLLGPSFYF